MSRAFVYRHTADFGTVGGWMSPPLPKPTVWRVASAQLEQLHNTLLEVSSGFIFVIFNAFPLPSSPLQATAGLTRQAACGRGPRPTPGTPPY